MGNTTSFSVWRLRFASLSPTQAHAILLAVICTIGFIVRINGISDKVIWSDEAVSWTQARLDFADMIRATAQDNYPPLHNIVLHAVMQMFSDSEMALRLPSALLGTLNIVLVYALGRILGNAKAGLLAAALIAVSPFHIWYSQEARPYALFAFCATLFVLAIFMALRSGGWRWYAMSAIAALLLLYTHPYGPLLWGSVGAAILFCAAALPGVRVRHLKLVAWQMLPAVCFVPWAFILLQRTEAINAQGFWIPYPTPSYVLGILSNIAYGDVMLAIAVPAILAALVWPLPRPGDAAPTQQDISRFEARAILFAWLIGPFVLGLAISLVAQPILIARYLICSLPAGVLLMAIGFSRLMVNRVLSAAAVAVLIVGVVSSLRTDYPAFRRDWRGVAAFISESLRPEDCLAVIKDVGSIPFWYYFRRVPDCVFAVENLTTFETGAIASRRLWLVVNHDGACARNGGAPCLDRSEVQNTVARFLRQDWQVIQTKDWERAAVVLLERTNP